MHLVLFCESKKFRLSREIQAEANACHLQVSNFSLFWYNASIDVIVLAIYILETSV